MHPISGTSFALMGALHRAVLVPLAVLLVVVLGLAWAALG